MLEPQRSIRGRRESDLARYEEIALMLARDIARGAYREGERIYGRSVLAGRYSVSPETVRKGVALLQAREVVEAVAGSGVVVLSQEAARKFVEDYQELALLEKMKNRLMTLVAERDRLNEEIDHLVREIVYYKDALLKQVLYNAEEIPLAEGSNLVGQSLYTAGVRTITGVTVTAVRRGSMLYDSPGRELLLQPGDVLLAVGSAEGKARLRGMAQGIGGEAAVSPREEK